MDSRRTAVRARAERHRALARVTERIVSATAQRHAAVTDFLAELDSSRIHRRQILAEALATQRLTESEWERVQAAASGRLEDNCPICLFPLEPLSRPCYLLRYVTFSNIILTGAAVALTCSMRIACARLRSLLAMRTLQYARCVGTCTSAGCCKSKV